MLVYAIGFLVSLPSIFSLSFSWYPVLCVPAVLTAVTLFITIVSPNYASSNTYCPNRFSQIIRGVSIKTVSSAIVYSASAWLLCCVNPFCRGETSWNLLSVGCAFAGVLFCYENYYFSDQEYHFPIIQTTKYSMFMSTVTKTLLNSIKKSFVYIFILYFPLYAIEPKSCTTIYFFAVLWFSVSLILYFFYSFEFITYIIMTERIVFPIVSIKQDCDCLLNALETDNKIIKSLALYDLYQATINDVERRKQIFSLSFAGNVPMSWKMIFNYCINNIKCTTEDITRQVKPLFSMSYVRRNLPNARLINVNSDVTSKHDADNKNQQSKLITFFEKFYVYNYLFGSLAKEHPLEELEATVWCCYILSNLAVVSLKEDEYGVVREQLGQIVSTILDFNNQLEYQKRNIEIQKTKKIAYLIIHVKTCAVMLALNFAMYANDIGLDETQLRSFKKIIALNN